MDPFVTRIRQQIAYLQNNAYGYNRLHVYAAGIQEPWEFDHHAGFEFDGDQVMVVRTGPAEVHDNEGVPEHVFPLRQLVAVELAAVEESR